MQRSGNQPHAPEVMRQAAADYALGILRWEHEPAAAALLARTFADDPLVTAICEGAAAERERRMWWSFRIAVRNHCLSGQPGWMLLDAGAHPVGVVLTTRPHTWSPPRSDVLFTVWGMAHVGYRTVMRGIQAGQAIAAHLPPQPFTYLRTLGITPELHRRGLGSRLVEQVIRSAPASSPIYLETAKEQNLSFYARHGFDCIGTFSCLRVPVWRLVRGADH